jgi:transcriptional regulator with XRE-family HTH domain
MQAEKRETGLRRERRRRGVSLEALAYLAGDDIDPATISRIEWGQVAPRRETVVKLSRALGMSVSRLRALLEETEKAESATR